MHKFRVFLATALLSCSHFALAEVPAKLLGKWLSVGVVWEFTEQTIATKPIDSSGKSIGPENKATISYHKVGDAWAINFKRPDGSPSGSLLVVFKDENTAVIDSPRQLALILKRVPN
jgi:hypothetical protein